MSTSTEYYTEKPCQLTTAFAVANWFIDKAQKSSQTLSHMKLQKLVYLAYGWYYAYYGRPLFLETISAWDHGPVVDALYSVFKKFGSKNIDKFAFEYVVRNGRVCEQVYSIHLRQDERQMLTEGFDWEERQSFEQSVEHVLNVVWNAYACYTASQLRNTTHRPETPWRRIYDQYGGIPRHCPIDPEDIHEYFRSLIKQPTY